MKGNKSKKALIVLIAIIMVFVFGIQCFAIEVAEENRKETEGETKVIETANEDVTENKQTTDSKLKIEKKVEGTNGSITFILTGVNLEAGKNYEYTVSKTDEVPENAIFKDVAMDYSKKQVEVTVTGDSYYDKEREYLIRKTDVAYLFVREKETEKYILEREELNLKLPFKYATSVELSKSESSKYKGGIVIGKNGWDYTYVVYDFKREDTSYVFEKISDSKVIEKYQTSKSSDDILDTLEDSDIPSNGWNKLDYNNQFGDAHIYKKSLPTEEGLYVLWLKMQKDGNKVIYGAWIYDNLSDTYKPDEDKKQEEPKKEDNNKNDDEQKKTDDVKVSTDDGKDDGKDETVTPSKKIPQTGESYVIFVVAGVIVLAGVIGIIRYRKYKGI